MASISSPPPFQAFAFRVDDDVILTPGEDVSQSQFDRMKFTVHVFGKTRDGESVAVHVEGFRPSFAVYFGEETWNDMGEYEALCDALENKLAVWKEVPTPHPWSGQMEDKLTEVASFRDHFVRDVPDSQKILHLASIWGFTFGKKLPLFNFTCRSQHASRKLENVFRACQRNSWDETQMEDFCEELGELKDDKGHVDRDAQEEMILSTAEDLTARELRPTADEEERERYTRTVVTRLRWIRTLGRNNLSFRYAKGQLYEVVDPLLRFAHFQNIQMAGWIQMRAAEEITEDWQKRTTCKREFLAEYNDLDPVKTDLISPEIKELAFDIEAYSANDMFPDAELPDNYAYQISYTLKSYASKGFHRFLLHFRTPEEMRGKHSGKCEEIVPILTCLNSGKPVVDCDKKDCKAQGHAEFAVETQVRNFDSERDMLCAFASVIREDDPDIIYGYNSDQFDWDYLFKRAQVAGCVRELSNISRLRGYKCEIRDEKFQSSARGDNNYRRVEIPGRLNIDLLIWVKANMNEDFYNLDHIAEKQIGEKKRDVDHKEIFAAFRSGDAEKLTVIGDYCCQDSVLVQKLVVKLDVVTQMFEMATITDTPAMYLFQKGQQIKCFSQIAKEANLKGFAIPVSAERLPGNFKGAIVLEPKTGKYDTPVAVLDFASLYPSIQMAYKVCYSTIVIDPALNAELVRKKDAGEPLEIDEVIFDFIEWEDDIIVHYGTYPDSGRPFRRVYTSEDFAAKAHPKGKAGLKQDLTVPNSKWRNETQSYLYFFAQNQPSVIPALQERLKANRKAVKGMMAKIEHSKDPDDQAKYRVLNGRQLAIKVSMNSIYGFTSAFMMNLMALSASVTAKGRQMIERTSKFMESEFPVIAAEERWTEKDVSTYFTNDGKEVTAERTEQVGEWQFVFRGENLHRGSVGTTPPGWVRKFPSAVLNEPWAGASGMRVDIVGGDTDSVFCNFAESSLRETISMGHKAAALLTDKVFSRHPIALEYEKTYYPMVIVRKKNYIALKFENDDVRFKIDYRGIAVRRRNYCKLVKDVYWSIIYPTLGVSDGGKRKRDCGTADLALQLKNDAMRALETQLGRLREGDVPLNELVMTASLKSDYSGTTCEDCRGSSCQSCYGRGVVVNLPHVALADRMAQRDPGSAPKSGQRFGYVVVEVSRAYPSERLSDRTEDPKFAKDHALQPDPLYYLEHQIRPCVMSFLKAAGVGGEAQRIFDNVKSELEKEQDVRLSRERHLSEQTARQTFCVGNFSEEPSGVRKKLAVPAKVMSRPKRQTKKREEGPVTRPITAFFSKQCSTPSSSKPTPSSSRLSPT